MRFSSRLPLVLSVAFALPAASQAPARHGDRPTVAICRDGSRSTVAGRGACTGHGGIRPAAHVKTAKRTGKAAKEDTKRAAKHEKREKKSETKRDVKRDVKPQVKPEAKPRVRMQGKARDVVETKPQPESAKKDHARHAATQHAPTQHAAKQHAAKQHAAKKDARKGGATQPTARPHARALHRGGLREARTAESEIHIARDGNPARCKDGTAVPAASRACASQPSLAGAVKPER